MRVAIVGRTEILYDTAVALKQAGHEVVCILTAKEAPEYTRNADDFEKLAAEWRIPFAKGARILDHYDFLRSAKAEVGVSVNYSGVIPQAVIELFPLGLLNSHGGDLPRYRGNACQAWAILNGENRIGLCVHRMIGGELDSGDILARDYLPIDHDTNITLVYQWMNQRVPALFTYALSKLQENPNYVLEVQSRDPGDALRCYPRRPEDGRIDWSRSNLDILRLVNASSQPYSGAFCQFDGQKVVIWRAFLAPNENFLAVPGQVTAVAETYVDIATGRGKLRVTQMSVDGEMVLPSALVRSIRQRFC